MSALLITVATSALLSAFVLRRRHAPGNAQRVNPKVRRPAAPTVARVHNPRALGQGLWQVRACRPGCPHSSLLVGRVLPANETIPLPANDPTRPNCTCHYIPVNNQRRGQRRAGSQRRDCFRMSARDRRGSADRRAQARVWLNSLR